MLDLLCTRCFCPVAVWFTQYFFLTSYANTSGHAMRARHGVQQASQAAARLPRLLHQSAGADAPTETNPARSSHPRPAAAGMPMRQDEPAVCVLGRGGRPGARQAALPQDLLPRAAALPAPLHRHGWALRGGGCWARLNCCELLQAAQHREALRGFVPGQTAGGRGALPGAGGVYLLVRPAQDQHLLCCLPAAETCHAGACPAGESCGEAVTVRCGCKRRKERLPCREVQVRCEAGRR